jgi:methyl-accepting chemotaxis protein
VTRSAEEVAHNASRALKAAAEVADARTQVTSDALRGIEAALKRFQDVADRYDELDENLGEAFETFRVKVNEVIGAVAGSAKEVHGNYADALDTLRELVDQAQAFRPQQRTT